MSTAQQSSPNQNETNETTSKNSPPHKTTTTNKLKTNEATALSDDLDSDPKANNNPDAVIQTNSKNSLPVDAVSQTTSINSTEKEDAKVLSKDTAADSQLQVQEKPSSEDQHKNGSTTTNKQEVDGTKAIQEDSAAVAEITPANSQLQPDKNESTLKDSSPAGQSIATHKPEIDEGKSPAVELPRKVEPHPPVQEISSADDEATPKELSLPRNDSSPPARPPKSLKEDSTKVAEPSPKKSKWKILIDFFRWRKGNVLRPEPSSQEKVKDAEPEKQLLSLIQADIAYITMRKKELERYNQELDATLKSACQDFDYLKKQGKLGDLQALRKDMMKLKLQDPSKYKFDGDKKDQLKNLPFASKAKQDISQEVLSKMPQMHKSGVFETSIEFKDFEARYSELDNRLKLCLLCFSAFPGNIIRKRLMLHWWISEGYAASEEKADEYFTQLIEKGFIEPVNENRSLSVGRCQMHPFYRSALVVLAERAKFLNFGAKGEPTQNFLGSFQSCLVGQGLISFEDLKEGKLHKEDLEKLHLLINVDEHILEFKPDWFSKMANLNFLYLGRWKVLATDHIEVEDTEFFSGFEKMRCVKFLSLQGISNIIALPKSILQMENLEILDVRACYNLETIPQKIDLLKNLVHLDMSECYLLDHMPKGLSLLKKLKVIKGFVVGTDNDDDNEKDTSCTLTDLKGLENLSKLCIYTDLLKFPKEHHVRALENLEGLCKLTITWGGNALRAKGDDNKKDSSTEGNTRQKKQKPGKLPPNLMKLDLKCFPESTTPYWLQLRNLKDLNLKKLYIRGGKLSDLGQYQDIDDCIMLQPVTWKVEVLRLKYLSEIKMEWRQLHNLFPSLVYLEQVSCPNLTLFPCDANGIWINNIKAKASIHSHFLN